MELKARCQKWENWIIAGMVLLFLGVWAGARFDYYYDLNDDVLMKDILAGSYTGTPEGHNIQMLWPISALLSLFYRIARPLPWYGLFLCFCHFGCFFLILYRSLKLNRTWQGKVMAALTEGLLLSGLFLEHLIYAQYTVTCTLLGATAAFLFYTTDITLSAKDFIRKNIPSVILVSVAYLIRSEMLLLVLPMICVAGVAKWGCEKKIFTRENSVKYLTVIGLILGGILLGQLTHRIAYGSDEWRRFTEFFDNRTELYDFQSPPDYEDHRAFYDSIGLSESEKILLNNYNFGMDEEIDETMIGEIAAYARRNKSAEKPFAEKLPEKLKFYVYRLLHGPKDTGSDYPWNYVVLLAYIVVFLLSLPKKAAGASSQKESRLHFLKNGLGAGWKLLFLFVVRTLLWMFILMRDRDPERITHSLYLMELCILAAMAFSEWNRIGSGRTRKFAGCISLVCFLLFAVGVIPGSVAKVDAGQEEREAVNAPYRELYQSLTGQENAQNFYFIDVYSSVSYSEKMFEDVDNSLDNYDIMGGWACKSPLQRKKLKTFGIENMEQALREQENVYFVRKSSEDMEWLGEYYEGHGTPIEATLIETVADVFEIYRIEPAG